MRDARERLSVILKLLEGLMQFVGGKGIALFIVIITGVSAVGVGSGILIGRQFPAHRFEQFGNTRYLVDSATGKICEPFARTPSEIDAWRKANGITSDFNAWLYGGGSTSQESGTQKSVSDFLKDLDTGKQLTSGWIPACNK
jgi:hypothetical protein